MAGSATVTDVEKTDVCKVWDDHFSQMVTAMVSPTALIPVLYAKRLISSADKTDIGTMHGVGNTERSTKLLNAVESNITAAESGSGAAEILKIFCLAVNDQPALRIVANRMLKALDACMQGIIVIPEKPLFELTTTFRNNYSPLPSPTEDSKRQAVKEFATNVLVVIQTLNDTEYYAALEKLKPPNQEFAKPVEYPDPDLTIVVGTFAGVDAAVIKTEQGVKSKTELEAVFENVCTNATWLLGLGVCYGLKKKLDLKFADVLVEKKIEAIQTPKFEADGTMDTRGEYKVTPRPVQRMFCEDADMWDDFIVCKEPSKRIARAFVGLLASVSILINDPQVIQGLENSPDPYLGGEMEGWAQIEYTPERVKCIIIKGIADFADGTKDKVWQLTAAMAAVDYAHHKLELNRGYLEL